MKNFLTVLFACMFLCGIAWGLIGRAICTRSNKNYTQLQSELKVPDTIDTVLHDEGLGQLYVCYNDANHVDVYTESGDFLWAVATPYIRGSSFGLQDGKLIIYGDGAYLYDAADGTFLGFEQEANLQLRYPLENETPDVYTEGEISFSGFTVSRADENGNLQTVISRPWWHRFFHYGTCLLIAFIGAIGTGILIFTEKLHDYLLIRKTLQFKNRKAKIIKTYFKTASLVHVVYLFLCLVSALWGGWMVVGIVPVAVHAIISFLVLWNMKDRLQCDSDEMQSMEFWGMIAIASFIAAVFSAIVVSAVTGV